MLDAKLPSSELLRRAEQTGRVVMAAGNASEKEAVRFAIGGIITADYVALRVNPVAFAGIRSGDRNLQADEGAIALNEAVLIAALVEVETDKVSLGIDAGDPRERGVGSVDCGELAVRERKTVELIAAVDVRAHNSCRVEGHGRESSRCPGNVDEGERVVPEKIAAPLKEVGAEKHTDYVSAVAEAKPARGWIQLPKAKLYAEFGLVNLISLIPSLGSHSRSRVSRESCMPEIGTYSLGGGRRLAR